jgi:multidrug efflux pump subunit AcrA (membrane-fusion protein)
MAAPDKLPKIPTPPLVRWREFNINYLPVIMFVAAALVALALWNARLGPKMLHGEAETVDVFISSPQPGVVAEAPKRIRTFQAVAAGEIVSRVVGADPKNPLPLTAPYAGVVTHIRKFPGETVAAGEPILTITAPEPDRIIAYLRQPMTFEPKEGMRVDVLPRARLKGVYEGSILHVSPNLAPIRSSLLPVGQTRVELGLPIIVSIPKSLKLFPGEIVDLNVIPDTFNKTAKTSAPAKGD